MPATCAGAGGAWQGGGGRAESLRTLHLPSSLGPGSANWISTIAQDRHRPAPHFRKHLMAFEMPFFGADREFAVALPVHEEALVLAGDQLPRGAGGASGGARLVHDETDLASRRLGIGFVGHAAALPVARAEPGQVVLGVEGAVAVDVEVPDSKRGGC